MTHIGNYAGDVDRFGDADPATPQQLVPDDAAVTKATYVLRMLKDAGLRQPFDWNEKDATLLWAAALGPVHIDTIEAAVGEWITQPGREWPSVGDMLTLCRGVELDRDAASRAHNRRVCATCHDDRFVRVSTGTELVPKHLTPKELLALHAADDPWPSVLIEHHHMAPCPTCPSMSHRRALYDAHHFDAAHVDAGGCPECWEYTDPPKARARAKATAAGR